jgi:type IV secretion system protein TrbG
MTTKRRLATTALMLSILVPGMSQAEETAGSWKVAAYGTGTPTLTCSPIAACLVALQEGESIQARFLADSAGWEVQPGTMGPEQRTPVIAVKPHRCGESTNLFVTTNLRIYSFALVSLDCDPATLKAGPGSFDLLRFTYPQEFAHVWGDSPPAPPAPTPGVTTAASKITDLNFDYSIKAGRRAIEPKTVYDDGLRTYLVLKPEDLAADAPAVFINGPGNKLEAVNFTPPTRGGSTYVVDRVVQGELVLVSGPKDNQKTYIRNRKGSR